MVSTKVFQGSWLGSRRCADCSASGVIEACEVNSELPAVYMDRLVNSMNIERNGVGVMTLRSEVSVIVDDLRYKRLPK